MTQPQDRSESPRPGTSDRARGKVGLGESRYLAFISYSHADRRWADWLVKSLETYHVPKHLVGTRTAAGTIPRRIAPVFRDRDELASAFDLGEKIRDALADAASLVVICSPRSAVSRWVNEEILAFKRLGRADRVFCLIVDGEPNASELPGREAEECFAPALRHALDDDGELSGRKAEPIAADARAGKDGKPRARLKLIAGLLDVGFDTLRQREQQRRVRRLTAITALAVTVMLITSVLAVEAVLARRAAQQRQKQAEGLVSFMLGNLNAKLRQVNRLDILQSVDNKAMAYFASLPLSDVNDTTLALRAKALLKIGSVRMDQGHFDKALKAFQLADAINRKRVASDPQDPTRLTDFGNSQTWTGFLYWFKGDMKRAEDNFRNAVQSLSKAMSIKPDDADTEFALANAYNNLGRVLARENHFESADNAYRKQIALYHKILVADPGNVLYQVALGHAIDSKSALLMRRGFFLSSIAGRIKQLQVQSRLAVVHPGDHDNLQEVAVSHWVLAIDLYSAGRPKNALSQINKAMELVAKLLEFDPGHHSLHIIKQELSLYMAFWKFEQDPGSAPTYDDLARTTKALAKLLDQTPSNASLRRALAKSQMYLASMALAKGDPSLALEHARSSLSTLAPLLKKPNPSSKSLRTASAAERLIARTAPDQHSQSMHLRRALDYIQSTARSSSDPRDLASWAMALVASGQKADAAPILKKLNHTGYRAPELMAVLERHGIAYPPNPIFEKKLRALLKANASDSHRGQRNSPIPTPESRSRSDNHKER